MMACGLICFVVKLKYLATNTVQLIQCSPFITLCLGSIGIDRVISELCYKGTILQRNSREMTHRKMTWVIFL